MKSRAAESYWNDHDRLPVHIQKAAQKQFRLWRNDHNHPSVHFKKVGKYWSARVSRGYRAVGVADEGTIIWFFIGNHAEYDRHLS